MRFKTDKQRKFVMGYVINPYGHRIPITPQVIKENKQLTYSELRSKGIILNPRKDIDKDKIKNINDCRPFDKDKHFFPALFTPEKTVKKEVKFIREKIFRKKK